MNTLQSITSSLRAGRIRLAAMVAVLAVAGTFLAPGLGGAASAQSAFPASRADCANWRSFTSLNFTSRADCVTWVNAQNTNDNGYGGGGNGNGGGLGGFFSRLFGFIGQIFQLIGSLLGRLF